MGVTEKLKERFCRDYKLPINVFDEPYFTDRLRLLDKLYGCMEKYEQFKEVLSGYANEQDYLADYNRIKDSAINDIKRSEAYKRFNEWDMNQFGVKRPGLPSKDIYKTTNDGRWFISIDMSKANFSSLRHYDESIFGGAKTWEGFLSRYTDKVNIIESKYIRQVILGNCNPKRHITYEKHLMDDTLDILLGEYFGIGDIEFFSNDEVVIGCEDGEQALRQAYKIRGCLTSLSDIPFKVEAFKLIKINGTSGYIKDILVSEEEHRYEIKGVDAVEMVFVLREMFGMEVENEDRVTMVNGLKVMLMDIPKIRIGGLSLIDRGKVSNKNVAFQVLKELLGHINIAFFDFDRTLFSHGYPSVREGHPSYLEECSIELEHQEERHAGDRSIAAMKWLVATLQSQDIETYVITHEIFNLRDKYKQDMAFKHYGITNYITVNSPEHKIDMMRAVLESKTTYPGMCLFVDDKMDLVYKSCEAGIRGLHISNIQALYDEYCEKIGR